MTDFHVLSPGRHAPPQVTLRRITMRDVFGALADGWDDFMARPSHYFFVAVLYPFMAFALYFWVSRGNALQLIYPMITGFALLGPVAALGFYEISRRREQGLDDRWRHALGVLRSPALPAIAVLGLWLLILFLAWIYTAEALYNATMGPGRAVGLGDMLWQIMTTRAGWTLIVLGNLLGAVFALVTLCTTAIAFPLLLDRDVGLVTAVSASTRAVLDNPGPMLGWGLIVAGCLALGALTLMIGLIIVLPVLGHATWHLYRALVPAPPGGPGGQQAPD
ncbi:DUF2189 domain-containing protein [Sulfitobacter sabulilitoris]|uniref:DUF2189 domain-containing protein n=1 Tax=Sulfitobacter sabulilitoris TaxID=2562655 RepID=A0A5S3QAA1_9RHOB|nr:DUF2189 domain-containing protein [Sulfitobacter sabulilitoris]TMM54042.1 DUF2189 domain-containing protein [Sulfitobacter sabulilitoris]